MTSSARDASWAAISPSGSSSTEPVNLVFSARGPSGSAPSEPGAPPRRPGEGTGAGPAALDAARAVAPPAVLPAAAGGGTAGPAPAPGRRGGAPDSGGADPEAARPKNTRFTGSVELDPGGDIAAQLASLAEEIIVHLRRGGADGLEINVNIDATRYAGFDQATVRTVGENARVLGLRPGRFEN